MLGNTIAAATFPSGKFSCVIGRYELVNFYYPGEFGAAQCVHEIGNNLIV